MYNCNPVVLYCRFILDLVCSGSSGLGGSTAILNVIETNPFKHLTHLGLKFLPGTDNDVKKYLAHCLKTLKVCDSSLVMLIYVFTSLLQLLDKIMAVKFDLCSIFLWVLVFEVLVFEFLNKIPILCPGTIFATYLLFHEAPLLTFVSLK